MTFRTLMPASSLPIEIFTEALQLAAEDRAAFLDGACSGDLELRRKIEALLKSNDRVGGFMEQPASEEIGAAKVKAVVGEKSGDQVDRYRLMHQIGEGGCG